MDAPMDNNLDSAYALLQLQGIVNDRIMDLSRFMRDRAGIQQTDRMCEIRRYPYQSKTILELCVDVELSQETAVSFWFELGCENKRWHVAASISHITQHGEDILEEYPEFFPANIEQLEAAANQASDWLVNRGKEFNFEKLM